MILCAAKAQNQDSLKKTVADTTIYTSAEKVPEFPGGNSGFLMYISKNLRYSRDARAVQKQGKVTVIFVVEKDGSVSNVRVLRSLFPSLDAEAIRVVSNSPKWKPGTQNGIPVRVAFSVPITFNISTRVYFSN